MAIIKTAALRKRPSEMSFAAYGSGPAQALHLLPCPESIGKHHYSTGRIGCQIFPPNIVINDKKSADRYVGLRINGCLTVTNFKDCDTFRLSGKFKLLCISCCLHCLINQSGSLTDGIQLGFCRIFGTAHRFPCRFRIAVFFINHCFADGRDFARQGQSDFFRLDGPAFNIMVVDNNCRFPAVCKCQYFSIWVAALTSSRWSPASCSVWKTR